ncbi:Bug family tripartite tricarboxylate transporter substrate binding protein [Roseomonas sp. BN140053]|uniref:Bug family tripartite tricarboxylate transporter substrate binding protein n=1 Tax=Roseomonas sp. BN140053 TaxID=3391898 RepID=UPI0039E9E347
MTLITRRGALLLAGALAAPALGRAQGVPQPGAAQPGAAEAARWPDRPVRVIVAFAPGGITDSTLRAIADRLGTVLGQSVVVENRPGGGAIIGAAVVAQSRPDGYTFLFDGHPTVTNPLLMKEMPFRYDTAFTPVTQVAKAPIALGVKTDLPARNLAEFVALAKARPGALSCGHSGIGSGGQLAFLMLQQRTGIQLTEVPYRGGGEAVRDLAAGTLDCCTPALLPLVPLAQAGRVRILAVTGPNRSPAAPEVPTLAEQGYPDAALEEWLGLFAPTGTPLAIQTKLRDAVATVLKEPEVLARLASLGTEPVGSTPAEFTAFMRERSAQATRIVRAAGIEPR